MFLGHYAVAMGAKRAAPAIGLGTLILAAQWADLLWPVLLLAGVERVEIVPGITALSPFDFVHYPITHSLLGIAVWGALFGLLYVRRSKAPRLGWILGLTVVSHWVLDFLVHRPDLPLAPGAMRVGLGLWNLPAA
ncbi:MAG TPA: metal-dependent hydrolase, partial [bacterium]|nr:metal-dependent hydrolase [bacterium]